ncbi:cell division protein ZapE [Lentilitoribacter sp. Alg239-R112]|uniref:cell division protein ZapE n=1 Tax=Lentilitoribacter sp. Alg239-R112 TaxID=2305987 RepID=UPI0013A6C0A8|nr:cell division protein ZapE [Lentilitoribacter sp. Alg239-R112]
MPQSQMSTVKSEYELRIRAGDVTSDPKQDLIIQYLDKVLYYISTKRMASKSSALGWLFAKKYKPEEAVKGLYIHGSVGRGKTMLMDMFFALVPAKHKRRVHFNDFMADVHNRIHAHREKFKAGETKEKDPVLPVATALYEEAWVLCFDEFSVTDIADAMILSRLFEQLFAKGCVLIATSNVAPDNLYKDGLNRSLFLPFIDILNKYVEVLSLDSPTDYRMEKTNQLPVYISPLGDDAARLMDEAWQQITAGKQIIENVIVEVKGRQVPIPLSGGGCARFSFDDLCGKPLGASDYIAIAEEFHTIVLDDVPQLGNEKRNEAKRFITLIDTLYDKKIRLFISADALADGLYSDTNGTEAFEFARTASRLFEMQSVDYLESKE